MRRLTRYLSACILAGLLPACGGGGGGQTASPPLSQAPGALPVPQASSGVAAPAPAAAFPNANLIAFEGEISALRTGGYTMEGTAGQGYLHINTTSSTTLNTHGGSAIVGHYALLVGTGSVSTALSAVYIATFTSAPGQVTLRGTYSQATP